MYNKHIEYQTKFLRGQVPLKFYSIIDPWKLLFEYVINWNKLVCIYFVRISNIDTESPKQQLIKLIHYNWWNIRFV